MVDCGHVRAGDTSNSSCRSRRAVSSAGPWCFRFGGCGRRCGREVQPRRSEATPAPELRPLLAPTTEVQGICGPSSTWSLAATWSAAPPTPHGSNPNARIAAQAESKQVSRTSKLSTAARQSPTQRPAWIATKRSRSLPADCCPGTSPRTKPSEPQTPTSRVFALGVPLPVGRSSATSLASTCKRAQAHFRFELRDERARQLGTRPVHLLRRTAIVAWGDRARPPLQRSKNKRHTPLVLCFTRT